MKNGHSGEMTGDPEAQKRVRREIERFGFMGAVQRIGVNKGLVYRAWKDATYSPTLRKALDLPPVAVPVPPCSSCGRVHTQHKQCDDKRKARRCKANGYLRRAVWLHESDLPQLEAEMHAAGCESFSDYVDWLRRIFDAHGRNRGEVAAKLVSGELVIRESE